MKKITKILSLTLALLLMLGALASCASGGQAVMTFADKSMSVNTFELLLSRMKGTLMDYGYDVDSDTLWKTIISVSGATYDDYFRTSVLEQASRYLIADYLFDRNGLKLTEEREAIVDELMNMFVKQAGSKTNLNAELKEFGANYEILRELYILETKIDMLKDHLYGENGEKIDTDEKEEYLRENYTVFGQIFLSGYYELSDKDAFGDNVYYTDDKHTAIAYDKETGETKMNEFGSVDTDIFGDPIYYNAEGRIAYDKENGVPGVVKDENGNVKVEYYDTEKLSELEALAERYAETCDGDIDLFLEYAEIYDESETAGEAVYLCSNEGYYSLMSSSLKYLDDITEALSKMEVGECAVVASDYGYHVICKYEVEGGAYDNEEYKDVFADFYQNLMAELFEKECKQYESEVKIVNDVLDSAPTMAEVGVNQLY